MDFKAEAGPENVVTKKSLGRSLGEYENPHESTENE